MQNCGISPFNINSIYNHEELCWISDVDIIPRKFKFKVRLPKVVRKNKEALSKEDIVDILNACSDIRLKTYVMFLAAGGLGCRRIVCIKDLNIESNPARVFVRGEYTKTRTDRVVFLTDEVTEQLSYR